MPPLALLILLAALLAAPLAEAASAAPVGRVIVATGTAMATGKDGSQRRLHRRSPVYAGDTVTTSRRSRVQIRFVDRALMSIRPQTEIEISDYRFNASSPARGRSELALRRGGFRTVTGRIGKSNRRAYRVRTPLATIGVRGTDWEAFQEDGGEGFLGVSVGGIGATSISGDTANLGEGGDADFAEILTDGTFILLAEAPPQLSVTPRIGEGKEEEKEADNGGTTKAKARRVVAKARAQGASPAQIRQRVSELRNDNQDTSQINPVDQGDGGQTFFSAGGGPSVTELAALQSGNQIAIFANTPSVVTGQFETGFDPALIDQPSDLLGPTRGPAVGLGAPSDDGDAVGAFDGFQVLFDGPPPNFAMQTRDERFAEAFLRIGDADVPVIDRTDNPGGITDALIGVFDATEIDPLSLGFDLEAFVAPVRDQLDPATLAQLDALDNSVIGIPFGEPVPFGRGPDLADLTATAFYQDAAFAATSNFGDVTMVDSELTFDINLGSGLVSDGILDVFIQNASGGQATFVVDFTGSVANGVISTSITQLDLFDVLDATGQGGNRFPATGTILGNFIGTSATPGAMLGFHYEESGTALGGSAPVIADGVVVLTDQGGTPPTALAPLDSSGILWVGTTCCFDPQALDPETPDVLAGLAQNAALSPDGNIEIGGNEDQLGDLLPPTDPAFFSTPVTVRVTNNEPVANFVPNPSVNGMSTTDLAIVEFHGFPNNPIDITSTLTVPDVFTGNLLFNTFRPALRSDLPQVPTIYSTKGITDIPRQGFYAGPSGVPPIDPFSVSFIADPSTGLVTAGELTTSAVNDPTNGPLIRAEFDSTLLDFANGGAGIVLFDDVNTPGGFIGNLTPLDLLSTAGGAFDSNGLFVGTLNLLGVPSGGQVQAVGTFAIPARVESRLSAPELGSFITSGAVVFNHRDSTGAPIQTLPSGIGAGTIAGFSTGGSSPVIMGNELPVSDVDAFALPADVVIRQGGANVFTFDADPANTDLGLPPLPGFAVGWGIWNSAPGSAVSAQTDPNDATVQVDIDRDVFFVNIEDTTPTENLAAMTGFVNFSGSASFSGGVFLGATGDNATALARGGSLATPNASTPIESLFASYNVDLGSGAITSGVLDVFYTNPDQAVGLVNFNASFDGQLFGAVADFNLLTLDVTHSGTGGSPLPGDLNSSDLTGALIGTNAERSINIFNLAGQGEHVEGFFLLQNQGPAVGP